MMAWRVGPPWFRRMLASVGLFAMLAVTLKAMSLGVPEPILWVLIAGIFGVPMWLLSKFGVTFAH